LKDEKACAHDGRAEAEAEIAARDGARHAAADLPEVGPDEIIVIDSDSDSEAELISASATHQISSTDPNTKGETSDRVTTPNENIPKRQKLHETHAVDRVSGPPSAAYTAAVPTQASQQFPSPTSKSDPELIEWACGTCTYVNHPQRVTCEMCFSNKPPHAPAVPAASNASRPSAPKTAPNAKNNTKLEQESGEDTWDCLVCGERGMSHEFWTCKFCGQVKLSS
jgi:hypothetical protein